MRKRSHLSWLVLAVFTMTIFFGSALTAVAAPGLGDVQGHWAADTIQKMVDAGVIAGNPDGTFKPDNKISRAEFATLVVKAFELQEKDGKVFTDTSAHWAKAFIATANANGIVSGYSDTTFGPDDPITREQMAVMIVKAAKWDAAAGDKVFTDAANISTWAAEAVATASANGVIQGRPDGSFDPQANATRAEAAVVINGAMVKDDPNKLDKAGTYGPATGSQEYTGNVTISAAGVTLQNAVIKNDLTITAAVADGDVTLKNVTVEGLTTIKGGGPNSITIDNCKLAKVAVNKADGKIRLALAGSSSIKELVAESALKIAGSGTIQKAVINANGVVMELKPQAYETAAGVTAVIGGVTVGGTTASPGGGSPSSGSNRVLVVADPATGTVNAGTQVKLISIPAGADIYYTLDSSDPTKSSTKYTAPITINANTTIKALATAVGGKKDSVVTSFVYTVGGVIPSEGSATADVTVGAMSFKDINVKAVTGVTGAAKFKVAGSSLVNAFGTAIRVMNADASVAISILAADGTTELATGSLDISKTASGVNFDLTVIAPPPAAGDGTATADVTVGALSFKDINVKTVTSVPGADKFQVAGSSLVKGFGTAIRVMNTEDSVLISILAADGTTVLATGTLDISKTASGVNFNLAVIASPPAVVIDGSATADVTVGALSFKDINVKTVTGVSGADKFQVAGSTLVKGFGTAIRVLNTEDSVLISILAADGTTVLATGTLDISKTATDLTIDLK